jgi:hypothetical protein
MRISNYVSVKLDLHCCVGVYTLWRPDEDYVTIDVHTKNHIYSFSQVLGDSLKMVPV